MKVSLVVCGNKGETHLKKTRKSLSPSVTNGSWFVTNKSIKVPRPFVKNCIGIIQDFPTVAKEHEDIFGNFPSIDLFASTLWQRWFSEKKTHFSRFVNFFMATFDIFPTFSTAVSFSLNAWTRSNREWPDLSHGFKTPTGRSVLERGRYYDRGS